MILVVTTLLMSYTMHRTGLTWNQWDGREPSVNPKTLIFLIGFGDHWTVAVKDCNGHWIHRDGSDTSQIVLLHKFLSMKSKSGAVYYFGDLDTKTIHDRVSTLQTPLQRPTKTQGRKEKPQPQQNKKTTHQPRQQPYPLPLVPSHSFQGKKP